MGQRCASVKQLVLHATAVFLETFVVTAGFTQSVQKVKSFEDVVC